jgi:hypothetical protein
VTHCRSCGAEIRWVHTVSGATMPLDYHPVPDGNIVAVLPAPEGTEPLARVLGKDDPRPEGQPLFKSHFATCPNANQHRRGGRL